MALIKNTNSYVTVEEANSYFQDKLDVAAYDSASDEDKAKALVTATSTLDTYTYIGQAISSSQPLAFPRVGSYFDGRLGMTVVLTTDIPDRIIKATFELAYHLLNNDGLLDNTGTVDKLILGPIELTNIRIPEKVSNTVLNLIKPLRAIGAAGGTNLWWRAN